jgi:hypothetical protein
VTKVKWSATDDLLFSTGGGDMTVFVWDSDLKELEIHENLDEDDEFIVERGTKPGKIAKQLQKQLAQKKRLGKAEP